MNLSDSKFLTLNHAAKRLSGSFQTMTKYIIVSYNHEILYARERMLILGFILPTAFLSMWISNTATTAMMVPILEAVIAELESVADDTMVQFHHFLFNGRNM